MPFNRQNDVTQSNAMIDIILQWQLTSADMRFPHAFKTVTLFDITRFFISIGYLGEVCKKYPLYPLSKMLKSAIQILVQCTLKDIQDPDEK